MLRVFQIMEGLNTSGKQRGSHKKFSGFVKMTEDPKVYLYNLTAFTNHQLVFMI